MDLTKKRWQWAVLISLALIWGTSFILMKRGLESYTSYQVAAFRIFISFVIFLPFTLKNIKKINKGNIKSFLILSFIGNGIPAFLFTTAQTRIDSSLAGILNSLTPLFTMAIGILFYKSKVKLINVAGLVIGLIGAANLVVKDTANFFSGNNWFALLVVIATLFYGINTNEVKIKLKNIDSFAISSLIFVFTGPLAGIYLLFSDFSFAKSTDNYLMNLGYIAILALVGSVIANVAMNKLLKYASALFVASVTYIIPIFAILWGIFDGEKISVFDCLWMGVILFGVYLVTTSKKKLTTGNSKSGHEQPI